MQFLGKTYNIKTWNGEYLGKDVTIDTETTVVPSYLVPKMLLCQAYGDLAQTCYTVPAESLAHFFEIHKRSDLIMQNAAFDVRVLEKAMDAEGFFYPFYDEDRIWDIGILYRLYHLAIVGFIPPKYNLQLMAQKILNVHLDKDDDIRMTFENGITQEHIEYGCKDVLATYFIYKHLKSMIAQLPTKTWLTHNIQIAGDYVLKRIHENGIGFDLNAKYKWLNEAEKKLDIYANVLACWGWVRGVKGVKSAFNRIIESLKIPLPRTETGDYVSKAEELEPYKGNQFIKNYLDYVELEKAMSFVINNDSARVHPRYNVLVNTGRTSCSSPNFQQLPRAGGIREMFIPSPGHKLICIDYVAIELAALAQVNILQNGYSVMGDMINAGKDLHKYAASQIYNIPEEQVTKSQRQLAKILNFGLGANMSAATFVDYAAGYDVKLTQTESQFLKDSWTHIFPEMLRFWNISNDSLTNTTITGRMRADCTYTAFLNTSFQGLAADGAKIAMWELQKAGFKIVGFCHDEVVIESRNPEKDVAICEKIMQDGMSIVIPDVDIRTEAQIVDRYCK